MFNISPCRLLEMSALGIKNVAQAVWLVQRTCTIYSFVKRSRLSIGIARRTVRKSWVSTGASLDQLFLSGIANTRARPSTATNKRFPTSSAYAISGVGIISFPFSVACTQCRQRPRSFEIIRFLFWAVHTKYRQRPNGKSCHTSLFCFQKHVTLATFVYIIYVALHNLLN